MLGVVGIIRNIDFSSSNSISNFFIPFSTKFINYNGDCSSVAERATVARVMGVRFSPIALNITKGDCIWTNKKEERK